MASLLEQKIPPTPRTGQPPVRRHRPADGVPGDAEIVALTLAANKPARDGSLDGVNAHWQWRNLVGSLAATYKANYKSFDEQKFRTVAGFYSSPKATRAI